MAPCSALPGDCSSRSLVLSLADRAGFMSVHVVTACSICMDGTFAACCRCQHVAARVSTSRCPCHEGGSLPGAPACGSPNSVCCRLPFCLHPHTPRRRPTGRSRKCLPQSLPCCWSESHCFAEVNGYPCFVDFRGTLLLTARMTFNLPLTRFFLSHSGGPTNKLYSLIRRYGVPSILSTKHNTGNANLITSHSTI